MSDSKVHRYPGKDTDVVWNGKLCIHVGECGRSADTLFEGGRQPWCQPDLVPLSTVSQVVERCPTGALHEERKDGTQEVAPADNQVVVANNGPLYLRGELAIDGTDEHMPGTRYRAALCRCGQSANKPFCDNAHEQAGFVDRGAIGDAGPGNDATGGPLEVKRAKDGPLLLSGNFRLVTASGRTAWRGKKAALCRCGESKNKPFCDGSHKAAGFTAD